MKQSTFLAIGFWLGGILAAIWGFQTSGFGGAISGLIIGAIAGPIIMFVIYKSFNKISFSLRKNFCFICSQRIHPQEDVKNFDCMSCGFAGRFHVNCVPAFRMLKEAGVGGFGGSMRCPRCQ